MENNNEMNKIRRSDHDTLIRLETKVDQIIIDVKELKDGTAVKLANHEARLDSIEKLHDEVKPIDAAKRLTDVEIKIRDFQIAWKVIIGLAATIGGITGFILSSLNDISTFLFRK